MSDTPHTSIEPPRRFRKKSVEVEAVQWTGEETSAREIEQWSNGAVAYTVGDFTNVLAFDLSGGQPVTAHKGHWIVLGHRFEDEYYPLTADQFKATYEPAEQDLPALSLGRDSEQPLIQLAGSYKARAEDHRKKAGYRGENAVRASVLEDVVVDIERLLCDEVPETEAERAQRHARLAVGLPPEARS